MDDGTKSTDPKNIPVAKKKSRKAKVSKSSEDEELEVKPARKA